MLPCISLRHFEVCSVGLGCLFGNNNGPRQCRHWSFGTPEVDGDPLRSSTLKNFDEERVSGDLGTFLMLGLKSYIWTRFLLHRLRANWEAAQRLLAALWMVPVLRTSQLEDLALFEERKKN